MHISVAMATFNGADHVEEQFVSLLDQRLLPDEIVISDDGSTDGTTELIRTIAAQRMPPSVTLRILDNQDNVGTSKNFERALAACTGDIIFLCDQDDFWLPEKILELSALFEASSDLLMAYSDASLVDARRAPLGTTQVQALDLCQREYEALNTDHLFEVLLVRNLISGCTMCFRRQLLASARPFPQNWVHDQWLAILAAAMGRVELFNAQLVEYRQHGNNQIGLRRLGVFEKISRMFQPRGNFHTDQYHRGLTLLAALERSGGRMPLVRIEQLRKHLRHLLFRASLPGNRFRRLLPVLLEALSGRYSQHSRGLQSVIRDLLERP